MSNGLAENLIALCNGLGAVMGILGSLVYPRMRRKLGVNRTGLIALSLEWSCLLLPVASIWLPGSKFDPSSVFGGRRTNIPSFDNCTRIKNASNNESDFFDDNKFCNDLTISNDAEVGYDSKCSLTAFITGIVLSRMGELKKNNNKYKLL